MELLTDTWYLFLRLLRSTARMPVFLVIGIVQPVIWLALFGQLFRSSAANYVQFLAPGVAIMTATFSAVFSGLGMLGDIDRGVLDRLLATPVSRFALIAARLLHSSVQVMVQSFVILLAGAVLGARLRGGPGGLAMMLAASALLGAGFAGLSNALTLVLRRQEAIIAVTNFLILPLIFTSTLLRASTQIPGWIRSVSRFNPVNWAVFTARGGFEGDWHGVAAQVALLAAFVLACALLATRAFGRYQSTL
jgi:ABC-2 type transport system permease protein